jgi:hypothetical protein
MRCACAGRGESILPRLVSSRAPADYILDPSPRLLRPDALFAGASGLAFASKQTFRNLGQLGRSEEMLRRGIRDYGDSSEFSAFLALTLYSAGRFSEAISILLKLVADTAADVHIKRYDRALRYYAANPDAE